MSFSSASASESTPDICLSNEMPVDFPNLVHQQAALDALARDLSMQETILRLRSAEACGTQSERERVLRELERVHVHIGSVEIQQYRIMASVSHLCRRRSTGNQ